LRFALDADQRPAAGVAPEERAAGLAQEGSEGLTAATRARTNASAWAGKGIGAATRRFVVVTGEPMGAAPPVVLSKRAQSRT
jgi:hypothetical protein